MSQDGKGRNRTAWILGVLLAFVYVGAGLPKLGLVSEDLAAEVAENFRRFGHSDGFRVFIGTAEIAGGLGLLVPRLASLAALGLMAIMAGAVYTHLRLGEGGAALGPAVLFGLLALTAWLRRDRLRRPGAAGRAAATAARAGSQRPAA